MIIYDKRNVEQLKMEAYRLITILVFLSSCLILSCRALASSCSSDNECLHFQYCCKGNCTWKRLKCEHICKTDHQCGSESRCVLGICMNCTNEFPCTKKACLNDSHCPGGHSCESKLCEMKKESNLTAEMAPFLIFIGALSVSLLIVCYNDYFLERLGQQGLRERLGRLSCNCSLTLWFWIWRLRRSQQQNNDNSPCPGIEVQFDSRSNPSNSLNEKPRRRTFWPASSMNRILFFWRRDCHDFLCESSPLEGNNSEESTRNQSSNPVILLNEFMNTNHLVTHTSSSTHQPSILRGQRHQNTEQEGTEQSSSDVDTSFTCCVQELSEQETDSRNARLGDQESRVNTLVSTCSREVTTV